MIKEISVTNHRDETLVMTLDNSEVSGFMIDNIDGLGPGKATINTTEITSDDGSLPNSSRISSRNIVLSIIFRWGNNTIEELRYK